MKWIGKFGFGKPTGIDFPGESGGIVPSYPDQWSGTTIGNVPIGQGIAVTPIQIASAYAAIANGGVWIQPHLVERVGGRTLHSFKHRRIVSPAVDRELKTMLTGVVDEHGATGNAAQIPGTPSPARPAPPRCRARTATRRASTSPRSSAWCRSSARASLVLVSVEEPHSQIFGGVVAAPAFAQIAKFDLQYLSVPPNAPVSARIPRSRPLAEHLAAR